MPHRRRPHSIEREENDEWTEEAPQPPSSTFTRQHIVVFAITFISYALIHATRKTLTNVKGSIIVAWTRNDTGHDPFFTSKTDAEVFLAELDSCFLFTYSAGLFVGGVLGDSHDARKVLAFGMWSTAIVVFTFGYVLETLHAYSTVLYVTLLILSGMCQSVAWPTEVSVMGNWFTGSRGLMLGVWSACASVGNIVGTLVASRALLAGYQYAFAFNCSLLFLFGFVVFFFLQPHPRRSEEVNETSPLHSPTQSTAPAPRSIGFYRALMLRGVIPYSMAYGCLKLVNDGFFFWLPYYLHSFFHWPESDSDKLSTFYDAGGIVAAIVGGALSDRLSSRTPVVVGMLLASSISLFVYAESPADFFINACLLTVVGFFVGGPVNMISSCVSADLGKSREMRAAATAMATVTGIIDGTGSMGSAFGQLAIPRIREAVGWTPVFYAFIVMVLLTAACLTPLLVEEWKSRRREGEGRAEDRESLLDQAHVHDV